MQNGQLVSSYRTIGLFTDKKIMQIHFFSSRNSIRTIFTWETEAVLKANGKKSVKLSVLKSYKFYAFVYFCHASTNSNNYRLLDLLYQLQLMNN